MRWLLALATILHVSTADAADPADALLAAARDDDPRSIEAATTAADAAGAAKRAAALPALIRVAQAPITAARRSLYVATVRAIGEIGLVDSERAKAAAALAAVIDRDPPAHPRTGTAATRKALEEAYRLHLVASGASINALGPLRVPSTVRVLVLGLYRTPELMDQLRRALVRVGPPSIAELRKVLRGEHLEVDKLFTAKRLDKYCGDAGSGPCEPVSARDYFAAVVLGDLRDAAATPDLLAVLARPISPAYYVDDQPGPTQYAAVFDALRKLGSPDAAAPLRAIWMSPRTNALVRAGAISAFAFVTRDQVGLAELGAIASKNGEDETLRTEAALAYARIARDLGDLSVFESLAKRFDAEAAKKRAEAAGAPRAAADRADADLAPVKAAHEAAQRHVETVARDTSKGAADVEIAAAAAKQAKEDLRVATKKHKDASRPHRELVQLANGYTGFARMFRTHVARVEVAARCKADARCYAAALTATTDDVLKRMAPHIPDVASWSPDQIAELIAAHVDRAMLELSRMGPAAAAHTEALLDAAASTDRIVRQSVLLALPRIAKLPCGVCETKLVAALKADEGKAALAALQNETTLVREYFAWAGRPTPK